MKFRSILLGATALLFSVGGNAQENTNQNKFRQLGQELPTPNVYRTASGAPGHEYWQQQANYDIKLVLDDEAAKISGEETVTYINNSPDELEYIWVQLDQNMRAKDSDTYKIATNSIEEGKAEFGAIEGLYNDFDGGFKIEWVKDASGKPLKHTINKTMMRIDLPQPLKPKASFTWQCKWWYNINDRLQIGGRSGYELFKEEDNRLYTIAQFYPRMAVYSEVEGWQHKQFLGRGEFALAFGDYKVAITVPADHIVGATGELQNASKVMTSTQRSRWAKAQQSFDNPVVIVTEDEAREAEKDKAKGTKTWVFKAENVRDFAFATSRKFIWDAMAVKIGNRTVMAQSFYPKEGNPLWEQYSTRVVAHTIKTYSKYTFDYPYPHATSVHAASIGMEYPMICFNFGRPEKDGTYTERIKYRMIGVIIHEVGHNFFPMIVNSDERQWTWMDEGLNTFVQYLTEQEWDRDFPSRRGPARKITEYMSGDQSNITPIMTNSESVFQFGNNAYGKPCAALNILRETVMGRELFDFAFKTYAQRWMFKHPSPADFFRTMEDASAVDLDWFWRGWFYTTDYCDIGMDKVTWFKIDSKNPEQEFPKMAAEAERLPDYSRKVNLTAIPETIVEGDPAVSDWYNKQDRFQVITADKRVYEDYLKELDEREKARLNDNTNYYQIDFRNHGGLVMPIVLEWEFTDGTKEIERIPAEIWKMNSEAVSKVFPKQKEVRSITLDPNLETADCDLNNNYWPQRPQPTRFELFKKEKEEERNRMQEYRQFDGGSN